MYEIKLYRCVRKGRNPVCETLLDSAVVDYVFGPELDCVRWFLSPKGYARRKVNDRGVTVNYAIHSEVMRMAGIDCPGGGYSVDHINGNKLDNRVCNLRWATRSQQGVNRGTLSKSGLPRGVTKSGKKYMAQITSASKDLHLYLGKYDTAEEASRVFEKAWAETHPDLLSYRRA